MTGPPTHLRAYAPAKLNLDLQILGRRADGFHELRSTFCAVNLYDVLEVRTADEPGISLTVHGGGPDVPAGADNLVCRAFEAVAALSRTANRPNGHVLELWKRIPSQAGMGGGSSDAAAALAIAARLFPDVRRRAIDEAAAGLGSDLNFFLSGLTAAICTGRGETISPVRRRPPTAFVVVKPDLGLSTADVFRRYQADSPRGDHVNLTKNVQNGSGRIRSAYNALLVPALESDPAFAAWWSRLRTAATASPHPWSMTGSGSAVFRPAANIETARREARRLSAGLGCWSRAATPGGLRVFERSAADPPIRNRQPGPELR